MLKSRSSFYSSIQENNYFLSAQKLVYFEGEIYKFLCRWFTKTNQLPARPVQPAGQQHSTSTEQMSVFSDSREWQAGYGFEVKEENEVDMH